MAGPSSATNGVVGQLQEEVPEIRRSISLIQASTAELLEAEEVATGLGTPLGDQ